MLKITEFNRYKAGFLHQPSHPQSAENMVYLGTVCSAQEIEQGEEGQA